MLTAACPSDGTLPAPCPRPAAPRVPRRLPDRPVEGRLRDRPRHALDAARRAGPARPRRDRRHPPAPVPRRRLHPRPSTGGAGTLRLVAWPLVGTLVGIGLATAFVTTISELALRRSIGGDRPRPHACCSSSATTTTRTRSTGRRRGTGVLVGHRRRVQLDDRPRRGPDPGPLPPRAAPREDELRRDDRPLLHREQPAEGPALRRDRPHRRRDARPLAALRGGGALGIAAGWWANRHVPQRHFDAVVAGADDRSRRWSCSFIDGDRPGPPRAAPGAAPRRAIITAHGEGGPSMRHTAIAVLLAMSLPGTAAAAQADRGQVPLARGRHGREGARLGAGAERRERQGLAETDDFRALDARLLAILDSDARIPYVEKLGPSYYNFWRDAKNPRGLWRRTTLDEYRKEHPQWETVLDLDALAAAEKENWVWHGADCLKPEYERCLVSLSRGGRRRGRRARVRPHDEDVREGRLLPARGQEQRRLARPRHAVRRHRLRPRLDDHLRLPARSPRSGSAARPLAAAETVFEGQPDDVSVAAHARPHEGLRARLRPPRRHVLHERDVPAPRRQARQDREARRARTPASHRDLLLLELRDDWTVGGKTYPAGALLAADFEGFLKGERRFDVLFEPTERKSLAGFSPTLAPRAAQRARQRPQPRLRARPQGRQVDARAAAGHAGVRHGERRRASTTRSRTTTS